MTGEKMFVNRNLLYAENTDTRFELDDLIDKQKRIAVRQYFGNRDRIQYRHSELGLSGKACKNAIRYLGVAAPGAAAVFALKNATKSFVESAAAL